jgi:hypothetical protein
MYDLRTQQQEAAEDIFFGQLAMIWARWFVVLSGIIIAIWSSEDTNSLVLTIAPVVALMLINFFLHGRYVIERPANQFLLFVSSLLDVTIVTLIVMVWPTQHGFGSPYYIFYYLIILGFAFVFSEVYTLIYTLLVLVTYTVVCLVNDMTIINNLAADSHALQGLVVRLITMASMGGLGTYYWRIQRNRRRAARPGAAAGD